LKKNAVRLMDRFRKLVNEMEIRIPLFPLIPDMLAAAGMLPVKQLTECYTDNAEMIELIEQNNGPVPYCCTNNPAQFFNRGIMRHTDSWASHNGIFIPSGWAKEVRARYPKLSEWRHIHDTVFEARLLPPVPKEVKGIEAVNSSATVVIEDIHDVVKRGEFVVAFLRDWTDAEALAISYAAYWLFGSPYDVWEIGARLFPIPQFKQLFVCASLLTWVLAGQNPDLDDADPCNLDRGDKEIRQWMESEKIDFDFTTPADNGRYLFDNPNYRPISFWCDTKEARAKI
jgi:hypothetical protein